MQQSFRITPIYDLLLRGSDEMPVGLHHLQLATAMQLCQLHYRPGCLTTVKARLKTLTDNGYIQADGIPTRHSRSPYYYSMGQKGIRYLENAGCDITDAFREARETNKHALFIEHTLEVNDLVISAALLQRTHPAYMLADFIHERVLKRHPYKATWTQGNIAHTFTIIPDAFLDFRCNLADGRQRRMPVLLEHDRGTEGPAHFKRRIRAYLVLLRSGAYQEVFGVRALTVAFTTFVSPHRLQQMREWTRAELTATHEAKPVGVTFCFSYTAQPLSTAPIWLRQQWFTPYSEDPPVVLLAA